ncbi:MAG: glycosyl hydrolase, partial [Bacteroidota bacterium]
MRCAAFCALLLASLLYLPDTTSAQAVDAAAFENMAFRSVGPHRGGRSAAVSGVPGDPYLYYFGATGGGVWKTTDGGASWSNISDGYFGG